MKQQTWEERFDVIQGEWKKHETMNTCPVCDSPNGHITIKAFIQAELQRQREEIEKKFITTWVDIDGGRYHFCYRFENNEWCPTFQKGMVHLDCEYCKQRDDIIKKVAK